MTTKSFSEFIRTALDDDRRAVYEQVLKKAAEEQNKLLEGYMEQIEDQRESILEGELIPAQMSERVFSTLQGLTDYILVFKVESARFGTGYMDGKRIYVLQYQPINYGGN